MKKTNICPSRNNMLVLSNDMLTDSDKAILRINTYETDHMTKSMQAESPDSNDISAYCTNKHSWDEYIVYDLKPDGERENISANLQRILSFADDMGCFVVSFTKTGPFPNYINLDDVMPPRVHEHPVIRKIYTPSIQSFAQDDIDFLNKLADERLQGFCEKPYGWFIDTKYDTTIQRLCENKHVKRVIVPYINAPYAQENCVLDLDIDN